MIYNGSMSQKDVRLLDHSHAIVEVPQKALGIRSGRMKGFVRPWHVRVSEYFVLLDFCRNERMFHRGKVTVPPLTFRTANTVIKVARMFGEVLDPVKKCLGNISVVRGMEPEGYAEDKPDMRKINVSSRACGLISPAMNLTRTSLLSENPLSCTPNACSGRNVMQLAGKREQYHRWVPALGNIHSVEFVTPAGSDRRYLDLLARDGRVVDRHVVCPFLGGDRVRVTIQDFTPSRCCTSADGEEYPWSE